MRFLWLDLETTGLDPEKHDVLEVAALLSKSDDPFTFTHQVNSVRGYADYKRARADAYVQKMHTDNGLWDECNLSVKRLYEIEEDILKGMGEDKGIILAGSSVHFDRSFIKVHMPRLDRKLSHRHLDLSAIKIFLEIHGLYKRDESQEKPAHRAMSDILWCIEEAKRFGNLILVRSEFESWEWGVQ